MQENPTRAASIVIESKKTNFKILPNLFWLPYTFNNGNSGSIQFHPMNPETYKLILRERHSNNEHTWREIGKTANGNVFFLLSGIFWYFRANFWYYGVSDFPYFRYFSVNFWYYWIGPKRYYPILWCERNNLERKIVLLERRRRA